MRNLYNLATLFIAFSLSSVAIAQQNAPTKPFVQLQASASQSVFMDEMVVTLAIEREGFSVGSLNQQVLQELNSLITTSKQTKGVTAKLSSLNTMQQWSPNGKPNGWKVRGEVVLESKEFKSLGELSGVLASKAQFAGVYFKLSEESRKATESELLSKAGEQFRAKSLQAAKSLGFKNFEIKEIVISENNGNYPIRPPVIMMKSAMADREMSASVPTEGGKAEVSVSFSGSVFLLN